MDIVYDVAELKKLVSGWHFELGPAFRSHFNEELGLAVDMVGEQLSGSYDKLSTITTDYGPAMVIGVEDLILKRLASAKSWKQETDLEQSYLIAKSQNERIDWQYLESQAEKDGTSDYLKKLKKLLEKNKRTKSKEKKEKGMKTF